MFDSPFMAKHKGLLKWSYPKSWMAIAWKTLAHDSACPDIQVMDHGNPHPTHVGPTSGSLGSGQRRCSNLCQHLHNRQGTTCLPIRYYILHLFLTHSMEVHIFTIDRGPATLAESILNCNFDSHSYACIYIYI